MQADAHFVIGQAHVTGGKPCQDYALAGELPNYGAYAVVADGCSSGGKTDVGARLLALATVRGIRSPSQPPPSIIGLEQAAILASTAKELGLETDDLLATCLYAVTHGTDLTLHLHGDGVAAWKYGCGDIDMVRFDWAENTPSYPAYARDGYAGFVAYHGGDQDATRLTAEFWRQSGGAEAELLETRRYTLAAAMNGITLRFDENDPIVNVAVFTDGVTQIEGIDWKAAVAELMNFKSTTGEFAKRRLNRFVRDAHKLGRGPIDDLAYAVIDLASREE